MSCHLKSTFMKQSWKY